jgi:hypothetical protein
VLAALLSVAFLQGAAAAAQDPLTPEQHLEQARQLIASMPAGQSPADQAVATLQRDFNDFASAYLTPSQANGATMPAAPATAPAASAAPAAGAAPPAAPASGRTDWRSKYLLVESDLTALIGPPNAPPQTVSLDAATVARLQQARQHLGAFYAATIGARDGNPVAHTGPDQSGAPVPPTGAAPQAAPRAQAEAGVQQAAAGSTQAAAGSTPAAAGSTQAAAGSTQAAAGSTPAAAAKDVDHSAAIALLDRMQAVVDGALSGKPVSGTPTAVGTSGSTSKAGKVTIDRSALDEIRAEITQIRLMLGR